jgi:uncharacterized repeat protein (TIGR01451 family)
VARRLRVGLLLLGALIALSPGLAVAASAPSDASRIHVERAFGSLPLAFEENRGQTDARARFLARVPGYTLFLTRTGAVLSIERPSTSQGKGPKNRRHGDVVSESVGIRLIGADPETELVGMDELPGKSNYFVGNDPAGWHTDVPTYRKVRYENVYPGIDLVYYGSGSQLEFDFVVAPGADPSRIRLAYDGVRRLKVDRSGDIVAKTPLGEIRLKKPAVYQGGDPARTVAGAFRLQGSNRVGFRIAAYDRGQPLTIDPVLSYATLIGPTIFNSMPAVTIDAAGNAYVVGIAVPPTFPVTPGAYKTTALSGEFPGFVLKLNPSGSTLNYSTFLGTHVDINAVAVDSAGNAYLTGRNFGVLPTTAGAYRPTGEMFVTKLNPAGSALVYSTGFGSTGGSQEGMGIVVNGSGEAYVTGLGGIDPTPGAFQSPPASLGNADFFVAKLNAAGTGAVYACTIGGSGNEFVAGIAVDGAGAAYIEGDTDSANFPTTPGAYKTCSTASQDIFVTKVNPAGDGLAYSTCIGLGEAGGAGLVGDGGIDVDSGGNAYITGAPLGGYPVTPGAFNVGGGVFVTKVNATGTGLVYSSIFGGTFGTQRGMAIAVDRSSGEAVVVGTTQAPDFPVLGAFQTVNKGGADAFVTRLNGSGSGLVYSTYLGGSHDERALSVVLSSSGIVYVAGMEGGVSPSVDTHGFPLTPGVFNTCTGGVCAADNVFVARILPVDAPDMAIGKAGPPSVAPGSNLVYTITVSNVGSQDAANVTVTDATPTGLTFVSNSGACTTAFPCSLGSVAHGASATITSTFAVPAGYTGPNPIRNTATVSTTSSDSNPSNDTATASTPTGADVSITKTGPASVSPGTNLVYTIKVTNAGPANAASVSVADATPAGLTFVSNTGGCTTAFPCALGTVNSGQTVTITSTFSVPAGYGGPFPVVNTATVSTSSSDPNAANNTATASTGGASSADISVTKAAGATQVFPGNTITYTINVSNAGPASAPSVSLDDPTPAGLTFLSNSGACSTAFPCALGTVSVGQTKTVTATYSVPTTFSGIAVVNSASVSSGATDPNPGNNSATATVGVGPVSADAAVEVVGPNPILPGGTAVYTITIRNFGPSPAQNIRVTSVINDLQFRSNSGGCTTPFPCSIGTLAAGDLVTIVSTFSVPTFFRGGGSVVHSVAVTSFPSDPSLGNNQSSFTSSVDRTGADLVVTSAGPAVATPGQNVSYTFTVINAGPRDAFGASLSVLIPTGLTFAGNSGDCGTPFPCVFGTLGAGQSRSVVTTFAVPASYVAPNPIVVTGSGFSTSFDPSFANNSSSAFTPLDVPAPARVLVTRWPSGMVEQPGTGGASDRYVLTNVGGTATVISLAQSGSFFSQSPTAFTLAPGASRTIGIAGLAEPAGGYNGWSFVVGDGVAAGLAVPIALLSAARSSSDAPHPASARLSLVAGSGEQTGSGQLTFVNDGGSAVSGVLLSDAPWLLPPLGLIDVPARGTRTVSLTINRGRRPDASALGGTQTASVWLITANGASRVSVADTVRPSAAATTSAARRGPLSASDASLRLFLPGVTHTADATGERDTDLWLANRTGGRSVAVACSPVQPCDGGCVGADAPPDALTATIAFPSSDALFLADAVRSLFGKSSEEGTLQFSVASGDLGVVGTLVGLGGSFGSGASLVPPLRSDRAVGPGESQILTGLDTDAPTTIHLFLQETAGSSGAVRVEWLDSAGNVFATRVAAIGPFATLKMTGTSPRQGAAMRITNTSGSGTRVLAFARKIPGAGDPSVAVDWARQFGADAPPAWIVPLVASLPGGNGSSYGTDLAITSTGAAGSGLLQYFAGDSVQSARIVLAPGATTRERDVARGLFQLTGPSIGYLALLPDGSSTFAVAARTFSSDGSSSFGADLPVLPSTIALGPGGSRRISHLEDASSATIAARTPQTFRTNLGLIETAGGTATVRLTLSLADGTVLGSKSVDLQPRQFLSLPRAAASILGADRDETFGDLHDVDVRFDVVGGTGAVIPFASSVESSTNDFAVRVE